MDHFILRKLDLDDFEQSMLLSSFAFQYAFQLNEQDDRSWFIDSKSVKWGYFDQERLCAQATLIDFEIYIKSKPFRMGGIAGVATWPEYRRQGFISNVLGHFLSQMKENGQTISMLHPFSFAFYRKFGWEAYIEYKQYEMSADFLPSLLAKYKAQSKGKCMRVTDWKELAPIYDKYAQQYSGMLKRDDVWWSKQVKDRKKGTFAIYKDEHGVSQGYLIYNVKDFRMNIIEWVSLTADAQRNLLYFIAQHDSMVKTVVWLAPINDDITLAIDNMRIKQEIIPYFMARIVDVEGFLAEYPFEMGDEEKYLLHITDEQANWNNGLFELCIAPDGKATLSRVKEDIINQINADEKVIYVNIQALSSWLLHYKKYDSFYRHGQISGVISEMKRLQNRIGEHTSYLTDFF